MRSAQVVAGSSRKVREHRVPALASVFARPPRVWPAAGREELSVLKLVVSALVTNAVRRDPSGSEARLVHLDVAVTRDGVHGSVDWFPERLSLDGDHDDGAMELRIVAAATTRWGIQDDGRRVWFDLARRGRELGPRPGLQNG